MKAKSKSIIAATAHRGWSEKLVKLGYSSAQAKRLLDRAKKTKVVLDAYLAATNATPID